MAKKKPAVAREAGATAGQAPEWGGPAQGKERDPSGFGCQLRQKGLFASNWTSVGLMPRSRIVR